MAMTAAVKELKTIAATATATTDLGEFEAIAAAWTVDREKDRIQRGAFAGSIKHWRESGKRIPLHWEHKGDPQHIIGHIDPASMEETDDGLLVKGKVDLEASQLAKDAWRLIKAGVVGLSFGYMATGKAMREDGGRDLTELDVFEISITPAPMNADTRILSAKSVTEQREEAEQVAREAEEESLPDVPAEEKDIEPEPDPVEIQMRELSDRLEALEVKRAQAAAIDAEQQRKRAGRIEREAEEETLPVVEEKITKEPFSRSRTSNWVARGGGLPAYIQHIAHDLVQERGMGESQAIQMAIGICKRWARGEGNVDADTRAKAAEAIAEWEKLKATAKGKSLDPVDPDVDDEDLALLEELQEPQAGKAIGAISRPVWAERWTGPDLEQRMAALEAQYQQQQQYQQHQQFKNADGTGDMPSARPVDPLRRRAEAAELEHASDGQSLRKSPAQKAAPKPEPELPLEVLRQRCHDEMLSALTGEEPEP